MARGDHLQADRGAYTHDGIDVGDGTVIHLTSGHPSQKATAVVSRTSYELFANGDPVNTVDYAADKRLPREETVSRAQSLLGQKTGPNGYGLLEHNCQHFARWCATGDYASEGVLRALHWLGGSATTIALSAGGVAAATSVFAASLSGAAQVSSALATVGGGNSAAGALVLSSLPLAAAVSWFCSAMADDPFANDVERRARAAARKAALIASVPSVAGGLALLFFGGRRGLSAAGISSALKSIGGVAGGGMSAGVPVLGFVMALPPILAGWWAYKNAGGNQKPPAGGMR